MILNTNAKNTWCIGCGNFAILNAIKAVINELVAEGLPVENIVLVSGIGCHAKIVDYIDVNSFYSLHGRVIPPATGIKIANPHLKVIGHSGDGDAYGEGIEHLIFAAKRNIDITVIVHNNRVYGLTTGQYTPTSPEGYKGRSTPYGTKEMPMNPLEIMLASGATFIGRGTSGAMESLKKIIKEAIAHKGFSIVDVLQTCVTYYNMYDYYDKRVYELKDHDPYNYDQAIGKIREWDYNKDAKIPIGVFYKRESPVFEESFKPSGAEGRDRSNGIKKILAESV
ncbi:MAG: thiamine pyrophosphate-dependent enzyme [Candidatus Omnitrophica bacterium]|nr:thiamine pyrophosphate-dependent enzyme [Candidatus Omnitrophota bacterium]